MSKVLIGIDTGVNTGFAVAIDQGNGGQLQDVDSHTITLAMSKVLELVEIHSKQNIKLFIEDARKRTWFGNADARQAKSGAGVREGIGSVKRDAQIWEDWCKEQGLKYQMIHPAANKTKTDAKYFLKLTGWAKRTNEHARDAAMLVFGRYAKF
ncbi:hypothetical protein RMB03_20645 [Acinetobacter sp. V91_7]|uniref:hypothetical protein n=1 Tax=unclassified Acinetobacter TaxID=196816 RepID=UPI00287C6EC9|nr:MULTISPECIES: hypothetical protein [unclassified Acinetobacter]MDS7933621.1 hypothetical protein [Acinetobacter sp. V91_4B]MDS7965357.1 hypothetical protein [Acinetobacter sp. V91_7]MDS8029186.1 hypothetical protein [Acinetobacter sp. V91_13]